MKDLPIRLGFIGVGRAMRMHFEELEGRESKFTISAAYDEIPERSQSVAARKGARACTSMEDLLHDPSVELVVIATRSCDHFAHAKTALEAGKDILLEKPMCGTYSEAVELVRTADSLGRNLYLRHNRRFEPGFQHVREIVESGILGTVFEIKLRRLVEYVRRDDWQTLTEFGGGTLLNWGSHIFDHALQFLDGRVKSVYGDCKRVVAAGDAEDHVKAIVVGENGCLIDVEMSAASALPEPFYLVKGTHGSLACDDRNIVLRYLDPNNKLGVRKARRETVPLDDQSSPDNLVWIEESIPVSPKLPVNMATMWDVLYETIRHGKPYPITNEQALAVMKVIDALQKTGVQQIGV